MALSQERGIIGALLIGRSRSVVDEEYGIMRVNLVYPGIGGRAISIVG